MEARAKQVEPRAAQEFRQQGDQTGGCLVREHHVPVAVQHDPGVGIVHFEEARQRRTHLVHLGGAERLLAEARRVAGGEQPGVAVAQWQGEVSRQREEHFGAWA